MISGKQQRGAIPNFANKPRFATATFYLTYMQCYRNRQFSHVYSQTTNLTRKALNMSKS